MSVDSPKDLYALPLEQFTAARNELADRLKAEGDADEATRVRGLKKPSTAAWTVNQLARTAREDVEALLDLRDEIEAASSAAELRSRTEKRRKRLTQLIARARKILTDSGHS